MLILLIVLQIAVTIGSFASYIKVGVEVSYFSGMMSLLVLGSSFWGFFATFRYDSNI
jgi:hypothetical protein